MSLFPHSRCRLSFYGRDQLREIRDLLDQGQPAQAVRVLHELASEGNPADAAAATAIAATLRHHTEGS